MSGRPGKGIRVVQKHSPASFAKPTEAIYIRPTKGSITLSMHRMFNVLLAKAHEAGEAPTLYRVAISRIGADLETESKNIEFLKDTARRLASTIVEWDAVSQQGKRRWGVSSMLASAELEEGGVLEYSFSTHIKEKLFRPDMYARLNLRLQNKFRSRHGLALYEQCARYKNNPSKLTAQLPWAEWAAMMSPSAGESQYVKEWKYFARDLLKPAIAEVNSVAEEFEIEALITKEGRRVATLQFKLSSKTQSSLDLPVPGHLFDPELRARLERLGVSLSQIRVLFMEYEETAIRVALDYTERRARSSASPLASPTAYFLECLKKRYGESQKATLPIPAPKSKALPNVNDLKQAFNLERARHAEAMFDESSESSKEQSFAVYLDSLASSTLKSRFKRFGPKDKSTRLSFFVWLAQHTWGDPSNDELLAFAASRMR